MAEHGIDGVTMTLADGGSSDSTGELPAEIGLTIAWHADPQRVGDRSVLPLGATAVSRLEPVFTAADRRARAGIADPYVSRRPLLLNRVGDAVRVDPGEATAVRVDGVSLTQPRLIGHAALDRGVVIELARRVVLLLHRVPQGPASAPHFGLIGDSLPMRRLRQDILRVAPTHAPVLVRGESGTGKELVARALHAVGRRGGAVPGAQHGRHPAATAASALFGHARGAFTGADRQSLGYFGEVDGGTIFLDEIGELPSEVQPMLLRVLETGELQPVGGRVTRRVDVRVVAATDASLEAAVDRGEFRLPLLHRLAGAELWLPPLRQRRGDIPLLLLHFLREELDGLGATHRLDAASVDIRRPWLASGLVALLMRYEWPGNVRELRNVARQIAFAAHDRERVRPFEIGVVARLAGALDSLDSGSSISVGDGSEPREDTPLTEARALDALAACGWSVHAAAQRLAVPKTTLYRFIEQSRLMRKASEIPDAEVRETHRACRGDLELMSNRLRVSTRALTFRLKELDPPLGA
ncbi:MAG: sigma-54-dependent Fis family transcriptional regulator [Myxococcales bacterium]|nr:sigma-54-dependent Fis family transcriptional regulator [Myxococcales bacterium]